ncbi:SusC/RagA family TonB-linked outer membrane protein [Flavobacterium sp. LC2016-01]|uniref:SusC/RagA family TonB-linked outer membrane protein n=1 Tax=Flavobacterium sp. LC2016-01 TaxID=2675876 RepID=UPI0012BA5EC1|nr:SusC/RagA family TonB-linked outer membrane protein [Flavobacterium sp. LC2016-01]MTH17599.1 SusC/RagA family TonB-linked outer membrane protein [Flavobacterium sp. LC2016-01]
MTNFIRIKNGPDCVSVFSLKKKMIMLCALLSLTQIDGYAISAKSAKEHENVDFQKNVKGIVVDESGMPMPGVSVLEKGSKNGTSTDFDGKFTLKVDNENAVIVVSYLGYVTTEVSVKGEASITVKMKKATTSLDEVVVVGYGKMKKKDLTGAIVQVTPDKLANQNPQTVQDILRGTPGIRVGYDPSAKGGGNIQIRGQTSVYTGADSKTGGPHNSPLIILDGMQFYGELSEINPDDIQQLDILKDASAASVYGSRAAAGVILISTKKGKSGKPIVSFTTNTTISNKSAYRGVYSPEGYLKYREDWETAQTYGVNTTTKQYEAFIAGTVANGKPGYFSNPNDLGKWGITEAQWLAYQPATQTAGKSSKEVWGTRLGLNFDPSLMANFLADKTHDWSNSSFRTGINHDNNLSVSGASDKVNYYMSFGYLTSEGAIVGNDYKSARSNMKVDAKITDWLDFSANVNFQDRTDGDITPSLGTESGQNNMMRTSPYGTFIDANGNYERQPMGKNVSGQNYNYYYERQFIEQERGYVTLNSVFNTKVTLPLGITYSFNIAPRYQFYHQRDFKSTQNPNFPAATNGAVRNNNMRFDYNLNNTLAWDYTIAEKHHIIATFVQEAEERRYWSDGMDANNIQPSDALGFHNVNTATLANSVLRSNDTHETADALMARLFYSFDNRYMLTATVRRDGYSAFGASDPYAVFPSFGVAWNFKNESWFNWDAMTTGKLRLSWGKNGNRSLADPYISLANLVNTGTMGYLDASGKPLELKYLSLDRMANPNLQWEKTTSTNIGLDLGFLHDRITATLDLYKTATHDMIMSQSLPGFTGFSAIATNLGEVQNKGFELSLNTLNMKTPNFEWRTTVGISYNENKIVSLYGNMVDIKDAAGNVIGKKEGDDSTNGWFIGRPITQIWDYKVTGIWQKDEWKEAQRYGQRPGDPKVQNSYTADDVDAVDADGVAYKKAVYNEKDKQFIGNSNPPVQWTLRNDFKIYKNWDLGISMYSYVGGKSLSSIYMNTFNDSSLYKFNFNPYVNPYWTLDNPTNEWARLDAKGPAGTPAAPGRLYDRSFVRLDNISIAYTLPRDLLDRAHIKNIKIYASVQNAATWSASKEWKYFGDPETGGLATRQFNLGFNFQL